MKKIIVSGLLLFFGSVLMVQAQMTKEEQKEWKKKLKSLTPEQYKKMSENQTALQAQLNEANGRVSSLEREVDEKGAEAAKWKTKYEDCQHSGPAPAASAGGSKPAASSGGGQTKAIPGLVFKVQIGAFKGLDLSKYFGNHPNFSGEVDADGTMKYTIGVFPEYWEADKFKKALRDMGVKGAWIVAYKDGKRIAMKDALEGAID